MKKSFTYLSILLCSLGLFAAPAYAHTFRSNTNITALLHIEPTDSPVAGQKNNLYFFIIDKQNQFQPAKCDCRLTVKDGNQTIINQPLFSDLANQQNGVNAQVPITFPKRAVYDIRIIGIPKIGAAFTPFDFTYSQPVASQAPTLQLAPTLLTGLAIGACAALVAYAAFRIAVKRRVRLAKT